MTALVFAIPRKELSGKKIGYGEWTWAEAVEDKARMAPTVVDTAGATSRGRARIFPKGRVGSATLFIDLLAEVGE